MRQFHIYLGFSAKLNRQSMASEHRQIYLLKVGFCEIFEEATALVEWRDRYRNGYPKVDRTQKDSMGRPRIVRGSDGSPLRVSLSLALVDDWDRIAFRLVNDYDRAVKRIEEPIKRWGSRHLDPFCLHRSIYDDVDERHRKHFSNDISVNHNGLGEIFCIRPDQITALRRQLKRYPLKDPLANEFLGEAFGYVEKIGDFAFDIEVARCG